MTFQMIDPELMSYASESQAETIKLVNSLGSYRAAARQIGQHHSSVQEMVKRVQANAARRGYSPNHDMTRPVPPTHIAKGISTYYDGDGKVRGQWVKSSLDEAKAEEARKAAFAALAETIPRLPPLPPPESTSAELCNVYTLTDCHVGMLAWPKETGEPWDLKIAERTLVGCFEQMVAAAPPARVAYVNQLGDFLHSDGMKAVTPEHGHLLDQDGRFARVVEVAIRVLRRVVDMALQKHEEVFVLLAEGNHDPASSIWLQAMFRALYENEPRVTIVDSVLPYYAHQHGNTMLAFHHGHLKKTDSLPELFAALFPKLWGNTTKRYCHTGHRHHTEEKEHSGLTVHQHPTLAAKDAYAARGGWLSMRQATAITYHSVYGEVARATVCPEMLGEA